MEIDNKKIDIDNEKIDIDDINIQNFDTLVLSGGSSKGILILGALQYAYDNFLLNDIDIYVGTSSGAIIGYLLAIGYTPLEIIVYICANQLMGKIVHFNIIGMINNQGASSYNTINETFEKI